MSAIKSTNRTSSSKTSDHWYEWYGSSYEQEGCHVSNDGPLNYEDGNNRVLSSLRTCNITQYMCTNNSSSLNVQVEAVEVLYEYEVLFNSEVNVSGSLLPYLEESMLEYLATKYGVAQCHRRQGSQNRRRNHRILNENSTKTNMRSRIVGINTQPRDEVNSKYTKCKTASSSPIFPGSVASECVPILGGVTVFVQLVRDDRQTMRDAISQLIQGAMDEGVFVVPATIERVSFVGNSTKFPLPAVDKSAHDNTYSSAESLSGKIIALVVGILSFMLLIVCCFCFGRRHRIRRSRLEGEDRNRKVSVRVAVGDSQQCLASLDSLALRGDISDGSLAKITESDNEYSCDTSQTSTVESNSINKTVTKNKSMEIRIGGNVDKIEECIGHHEDKMIAGGHEVESIVASTPDELDMLDQLALHGRTPSYPLQANRAKDDFPILTPSRSLSPTTISAASQSMMYSESRKIVVSPTTCSQSTMRAGNLRYFSTKNRRTLSAIATKRYPNDTISTAYTPDSFDVEILGGLTSDDSEDNQNQIKGNQEPSQKRTFADVLNGHDAYINDDLISLRSDNENACAVQQRLQMS